MVTKTAMEAATDRNTKEVTVVLLTISSPEFTETMYFALNDEKVTSNGQTYLPSSFQYKAPAQGDRIATAGQLRIDNVDRSQSLAIIDLNSSPDITLAEVLISDPDVVQKTFPPFEFFGIGWDLSWMEGAIGVADDQDAPSVSYTYSPKEAPALYAN